VAEFSIAAATDADDAFFRELEFQTTWESIPPAAREHLTHDQVREAAQATNEILLSQPGHRLFVARAADGRRAALLWLGRRRDPVSGQEEAWIYSIAVAPEFRRRGLARQLLRFAEQLARQEGFAALGLMVAAHNDAARRLYESADFETTQVMMRKPL